MKKHTLKQRNRDVIISFKHRSQFSSKEVYLFKQVSRVDYKPVNDFIEKEMKNGLHYNLAKNRKKGIVIHLPEVMDFEENYNTTVQHLTVISKLVQLIGKNKGFSLPRGSYNLGSVNFDKLRSISTPAALVLTAEISNWEDSIRNKLEPKITRWNDDIYQQLNDLGFFDLFLNQPEKPKCKKCQNTDKKLVRYIKGFCGDTGKIKELKRELSKIVGDDIKKWNFLNDGLDEAITNVFHHAYPKNVPRRSIHESWYLTGSYQEKTKQLKVVFYDLGVGIPSTLTTSGKREKALEYLSQVPAIDRKKDEVLLKAAVDLGRTRTGRADRGKGLQDLLEFIKQRKNGHLSILSAKGQYSFSVNNDLEEIKTARSLRPISGTIITWSVTL